MKIRSLSALVSILSVSTAVANPCVPAPTNMVAWWPGDGNANEIVGGNNGTLMNGLTFSQGEVGPAFSFDGTNDYVEIPNSAALNLSFGHTVDLWVKVDAYASAGTYSMLISKWVNGAEDKSLAINSAGKVSYYLFNCFGGVPLTSSTTLALGTWYHIAATYDGANAKIYINGLMDASKSASGDVADSNGKLYFGHNPALTASGAPAVPFRGQADEIEWFNRALSTNEIAAIYNAGSAGKCKPTPPTEILHLDIARTNSNVLLTWTNTGATLQSSLVPTGVWSDVSNAVTPLIISPTNLVRFFRLCAMTTPTVAGYVAPSFTTGISDPFGCGCTSPENPNSLAAGGGAQDNGMGSVLLHTGELTQDAVDLEIPGRGFNWRFERRYRSGMNYDGPMGQGWDFNYNRRLAVEANGNVLCVNGLGRADRYSLNTNGTFTAPAGFYTGLKRNLDGTFEERDRHGMTNFYSVTNSLGIAKLSRISDRNANQMTFQYNPAGRLTNVVDTLARSIAYCYDAYGRLTNVTDFAGRVLRFAYDSNGNLTSATSPAVTGTPNGNDFPFGKTTLYTYASGFGDSRFNHNLLSVTAPNEVAVSGPVRLLAQYDTNPASTNADRLVSLRVGGTNASGVAAGGTISYTYASFGTVSSNDYVTAVFQNTVTNRSGNVTEYRFNQLGNTVRSIQFTRGARAGDPVGYTNTSAFNRDGEKIGQTNAELDSVQYTFNSANSDRLQQGNLLQIRRLPGPRGGDQSQIVLTNSYETNFNFLATSTDGRSNTTSHSYDSSGNRIHTTHRLPSIVDDYEYNAFGQMTAHTLPENDTGYRRRDEMQYYSSGPQNGYLQNQIVAAGSLNLTTAYEYDSAGNLSRMIDPLGNDTLYSVNALNEVVRESSREVSTVSGLVRYIRDVFYDANDNAVRTDVQNRDETGAVVSSNPAFTTTHTYNILDHQLSTTQEVSATNNVVTAYSYEANDNLTLTRFGEAVAGRQTNNVVQTIYDERDLMFRVTRAPSDAAQSTDQYDYDANGNMIRTSQGIESSPRIVTASFDGYNRRTTQTDSMGNTATWRYDANGNSVTNRRDGELTDLPGSANNVRLAEIVYTYDAMDRLVQTDQAFFDTATGTNIAGGHAISQTVYSGTSQVMQTIDANGHTNTTTFDTANRPSLVTDAKGNTVAYGYDANGRVIAVAEVDKSDLGSSDQTFFTQNTYDNLDRLIQRMDNIGNTNGLAYDSRNDKVAMADGRGNVTRYDYDGLNRPTSTTRFLTDNGQGDGTPVGAIITRQSWDDDSRLTGQADGNTNTTTYVYDALDRRIRTVFADSTTNSASYDVHNNAISVTDADGNIMNFSYDLLNRQAARTITRGSGVSGTTNEFYKYDGLSRIVQAQDDDSVVTQGYDSLSHVVGETQQRLPGGPIRTVACTYDDEGNRLSCTYPGGRIINYTYDSLDRLQIVTNSTGLIAQYNYFGPGRVERRDYGNATRASFGYDGIRRIIDSLHTTIIGSTNIDSRSYAWDAAYNNTAANDLLSPAQDSKTFSYDSVDRLTQSETPVVGPTNAYSLDSVGNRLSVTGGTNAGSYFMNPAMPPADFQMNQYTTTPFDARTNDADGNLVNAGPKRFVYDYRNQLVSYSNSVSGISASYKYDPFGRRIEKSVSTSTNRYYYSGWQEIEEQNGANATLATYVWGNGIDELLEMDRGGQQRYFHEDDLGSIHKVTDSTGSVVEQYRYDDYGQPTFLNAGGTVIPSSQITNATLFTGRRYDAETGLYYYRTRYLDPAAGRFVSRDSIGIWGDPDNLGNGNAYVGNSPVTADDPMGEGGGNAIKGLNVSISTSQCFIAGTPVWTPTGSVPIEELRPGDLVLIHSDATSEEFDEVVSTSTGFVTNLVDIETDAEQLTCTTKHPFWVIGAGWTGASDLHTGDFLCNHAGDPIRVLKVSKYTVTQPVAIFNMIVAKQHCYLVGESGILVHNGHTIKDAFQECKPPPPPPPPDPKLAPSSGGNRGGGVFTGRYAGGSAFNFGGATAGIIVDTKGASIVVDTKGASIIIETKGASVIVETKGASFSAPNTGAGIIVETKGASIFVETKGASIFVETKGASFSAPNTGADIIIETKGASIVGGDSPAGGASFAYRGPRPERKSGGASATYSTTKGNIKNQSFSSEH